MRLCGCRARARPMTARSSSRVTCLYLPLGRRRSTACSHSTSGIRLSCSARPSSRPRYTTVPSQLSLHDQRHLRLEEKLRRELGAVVLDALADPRVIEVMLNPDGRLWIDELGV